MWMILNQSFMEYIRRLNPIGCPAIGQNSERDSEYHAVLPESIAVSNRKLKATGSFEGMSISGESQVVF